MHRETLPSVTCFKLFERNHLSILSVKFSCLEGVDPCRGSGYQARPLGLAGLMADAWCALFDEGDGSVFECSAIAYALVMFMRGL